MSSLDTPLQSSLNCVDTNKILTGLYIAAVHILDSTHNTVNQEQNTGLRADTYVNIAEQQCMNHCYMQKQRETQTHTAEPKQNMYFMTTIMKLKIPRLLSGNSNQHSGSLEAEKVTRFGL